MSGAFSKGALNAVAPVGCSLTSYRQHDLLTAHGLLPHAFLQSYSQEPRQTKPRHRRSAFRNSVDKRQFPQGRNAETGFFADSGTRGALF